MTKQKKPPKLTLTAARASRVQDALDALVDARTPRAAALIRALPEDELRLLLFAAVTSVDPRWRFPARTNTLLPAGTEDQEALRRDIAAILVKSPCAITPYMLALSDAVAQHDPRRQDQAAA